MINWLHILKFLVSKRIKYFYLGDISVHSKIFSQLVARSRIFRLFMKGKFDAYILWPLAKRVQNWIVNWSTAYNVTVLNAVFNTTNSLLFKSLARNSITKSSDDTSLASPDTNFWKFWKFKFKFFHFLILFSVFNSVKSPASRKETVQFQDSPDFENSPDLWTRRDVR